jgi:pyrrolidone-carboxylate peptidase
MKNAGRHVNVTLLNKFKEKFNKDEAGKSRNWRQIEEDEIAALFKQTRIEVEAIIEQFKKIELPANVTEMEQTTPDAAD